MSDAFPIRFGLKAERRWDGTFFVLEWFETPKIQAEKDGIPARQACGIVDASVMVSHKKDYYAFKDHKETFAEILYPRAIAVYPEVLFDLEIEKPEEKIPEPVLTPAEPEKKGRKRKDEKSII